MQTHGFLTAFIILSGCHPYYFDTFDKQELGKPPSAVWNEDEFGQAMLIFSNLPDLCEAVASAQLPSEPTWWLITLWTEGTWVSGSETTMTGYGRSSVVGEVDEFAVTDATVQMHTTPAGTIFKSSDDDIKGKTWITFDSGEEIKAKFEASRCQVDLFTDPASQ